MNRDELAVLISIAPEFVEKIAAGTKTVELRRRFPHIPPGTWMFFYATLPVGAVVGRARILSIERMAVRAIWDVYSEYTGLNRERFDLYFRDVVDGYAIQISDYEPLEPIPLPTLRRILPGFVAPQSYRYLDKKAALNLAEARIEAAR